MSYKICATKKDLDSISRNLLSFDPNLWEVKVTSGNYAGIYLIVEDSGVYRLYRDGADSNKTVSIPFIRGLVYEGQLVNVNTGSSFAFGALTKIGYTQQKAATKNVTISEGLRLQGESANYVLNRLVREEDIKAPTTVYFWYDSRYLKAEVIRNNGYNRIPMNQIDEGMAERIPGVEVSSADQKNLCNIGMSCTVGEIIRITKSDNSDYLIHLDSIVGYDSLENITLPDMTEEGIDLKLDGEDGFFEFVIQQDCFAKFSVPTTDYGLWVQNYTISSQSAYTVDLTAVIEELQLSLYSGSDDLQGNHVSETPIIQVAEGKVVDLLLSVNMANDYTVEKFELLNIASGEITQLVLDDNNHAQFIMPSSLCAITLVIVEAEAEPVQPITNAYILTIQSPTLSQVTVNGNVVSVPGTVEFATTGSKTATANVVWEPSVKSISKVSVYPTGGSPTPSMIKKLKTTNTTIQLGRNMTLEIVTNPISCEYTHINGVISDLSKNSKWSSDNKVVDVVGGSNGNLYEYYNTTETTISNTPNNNPFAGEDVVDVAFYTDLSHFGFANSSFRDCDSLKKVSISGPSTIAVDTDTFRNSTLKELVGQEKITYLGRASFLGTNLQSFENHNISAIPDLTFNSSSLNSINLSNAPLTSIGEQVFDNCKKLKHVWLPKTLSYLGDQCFGETAIQAVLTYPTYKEVSAPINSTLKFIVDDSYNNGLVEIPNYTFEFCGLMREAYLPKSIEFINTGAFLDCKSLISFESPGLWHVARNSFKNTILDDSKMTYLEFLNITGSHGLGFLFFANSEEIGKNVKALSSYILPNSNENISIFYRLLDRGYSANYVSGNLVGTSNCISIAPHACTGHNTVPSFTSVSFSPVLKEIGEYAFYKNKKLKLVRGGQSGTVQTVNDCTIQPYAFAECRKLQEVYTTDWNLKTIKNNAFLNCVDLIPLNFCIAGTEYIGDYAFDNTCRAAYDKFNNLRIINGFALFAAAVAYTLMCEYAFTASMTSSGSTTPDTSEEVTTVVSEINDLVADDYYLFLPGGHNINGMNSALFDDLQSAELWVSEYNAALETLKAANPIPYTGSIADLLQADLSGFTEGTLFLMGNHDYIPARILKDTGFFDGTGFLEDTGFISKGVFVGYIPMSVYSYAGRVVQQVAKAGAKVVGKIVSKAAGAGLATALAGISAAAGFYALMTAIDSLVWSFYDYPTELVLALPNYYNAVVHGAGIWASRGVYDLMLPETLSFLGKGAFRNCKDLKSVIFLNSPLIIRASTFEGCEFLKNVKCCRNVQTDTDVMLDEDPSYYNISVIEKKAFFHCQLNVSTVNKLISTATRVEDYAFAWNLPMTLYNGFRLSIDDIAKCSKNYTVIIPPILTHIGKYAFGGARLIKFESIRPELLDIDKGAFYLNYPELGDYSPYFGVSELIFMVPEQCVNEYKQRFEELGLSGRMVAYNTNLEIVREV